jgi:hypothetical protein
VRFRGLCILRWLLGFRKGGVVEGWRMEDEDWWFVTAQPSHVGMFL